VQYENEDLRLETKSKNSHPPEAEPSQSIPWTIDIEDPKVIHLYWFAAASYTPSPLSSCLCRDFAVPGFTGHQVDRAIFVRTPPTGNDLSSAYEMMADIR
jgi:hypothetical protein